MALWFQRPVLGAKSRDACVLNGAHDDSSYGVDSHWFSLGAHFKSSRIHFGLTTLRV